MRRAVVLLGVVLCLLGGGDCATTATATTTVATAIATSSVGEGQEIQSYSVAPISSTGPFTGTSGLVLEANTATTLSTLTTTTTPSALPTQTPQRTQEPQFLNSTVPSSPQLQSQSQPQQPTTPSPLTKARIIGLAVGLAIADILLVGLCCYFFLYRRRHNLSILRLKKRFARDKNNNEDVAELRGPPVYAQEREDEGVRYEVYVEPSEVQGTVCYHELAACGEISIEARGRRG